MTEVASEKTEVVEDAAAAAVEVDAAVDVAAATVAATVVETEVELAETAVAEVTTVAIG